MQKLSVNGFGTAFGLVHGLFMLVIGLGAAWFGWGNAYVAIVASMFPGFAPGIGGAVVGAVYGIILGYILGAAIAWLYNWAK